MSSCLLLQNVIVFVIAKCYRIFLLQNVILKIVIDLTGKMLLEKYYSIMFLEKCYWKNITQ